MTDQEAGIENLGEEPSNDGGLPRKFLWAALAVLALGLLGVCGALVITLDLIPSADQPTAIPSPLPSQSSIAIVHPIQDDTVDISQPLEVTGVGRGLFEGNLVVQVYDGQSNLLAEAATIIDSPDAATGGSGPWSVTLNLAAPSDLEGLIFAFSNSAVDGSITASSSVEVAYVDSSAGEAAIVITAPDRGSTVDITNSIHVVGGGVGLFENNVVVRVLDETGRVLAEQVTTTDAAEPGGAGRWSANLTARVTAGTAGRIIAFSPSPDGDTPDASDEIAVTFGTPPTAEQLIAPLSEPTSAATAVPTVEPTATSSG